MGHLVRHPRLKPHRAFSADVVWIALHFAFVASLSIVYVRREAWTPDDWRPKALKGAFGRRVVRRRITREELLRELRTHDMEKQGLDALDLSPDGSQALARDEKSDELVIYDLEARKEISRPMPMERVAAAKYLPDGKGVLLVDFCGAWVGRWDTRSHRLDYRLRIAGNTGMCLSVSPGGRWAVAAGPYCERTYLIDLRRMVLARAIPLEGKSVNGSTWAGKRGAWLGCGRLVTCSHDGYVALWETATGCLIRDFHPCEVLAADGLSVSPDGRRMAVGTVLTSVIVDLEDGRELAFLDVPPSDRPPFAIAVSGGYRLNEDLLWDGYCLWRRRFPEWWWGHFYRPEIWAAIVLGVIWLWSVVKYARARLRKRAVAG